MENSKHNLAKYETVVYEFEEMKLCDILDEIKNFLYIFGKLFTPEVRKSDEYLYTVLQRVETSYDKYMTNKTNINLENLMFKWVVAFIPYGYRFNHIMVNMSTATLMSEFIGLKISALNEEYDSCKVSISEMLASISTHTENITDFDLCVDENSDTCSIHEDKSLMDIPKYKSTYARFVSMFW